MKAPFPYFGGKSKVAHDVWVALGDVKIYIEPFFGSGAVLLNRPPTLHKKIYEVVNDKDGFVANAWRALQHDPDAVAKYCDWPCNHADLSARKRWLIGQENELLKHLIADESWYDVKAAGYWVWAASHWIGSGLTSIGQRPHLTHDRGIGQIPHLTCDKGIGQIPHLTDDRDAEPRHVQDPYGDHVYAWFRELSERLRHVKVVCGDWNRVCGGNWQTANKPCGIFFDPPYAIKDRDDCYHKDDYVVAHDVMEWCKKRGDNKDLRIVLAGYEEHMELLEHGWTKKNWKAVGGYSRKGTNGEKNAHRECLYFSPHCLKDELF